MLGYLVDQSFPTHSPMDPMAFITADRIEPSREFRWLSQLVDPFVGDEDRVVDGVGRQMVIIQKSTRVCVKARCVVVVKLAERRRIATT
mgnify:CR=1 FL=1